MNIHPVFVHFPIALLTLYAILEILPMDSWYPRAMWTDIKAFLVIVGGLGLLFALATGQLAEHSSFAEASRSILGLHKYFAGISTAVFGILAAAYLIRWVFEKHPNFLGVFTVKLSFLKAIADFILKRWLVVSLALVGFIVLGITGALGGIMVYGPNGDFFTKFIYSVFFG